MARDVRTLSPRARLAWGLFCIALGCYPIAMAFGFIDVDPAELTSPPWVIAGAGLAFVIAGLMILLAMHSRLNDLLAGVLCLLFGIMGTWVSLLSSDDGFSGGLFFLSPDANILLGRIFFGIGALISFGVAFYALQRASR